MILNKFQEQIENMKTSEILGSNYGCKKCSTNKESIIKSPKIKTKSSKKTKPHREIKKKSLLVNRILLIILITILIFALTSNIDTLNFFNLNILNNKINGIKYYILSKIYFNSKHEIN